MKNGKQILKEYVDGAPSNPNLKGEQGSDKPQWPSAYPTANKLDGLTEPLEVLLLHEDLQTGLRAKYILDNLEAKLVTKPRFLVELWRFDMLQDPELQVRAAEDAKRANIVIISLHGGNELPVVVRNWLHRWIRARSGSSCALVASLDASVQGSVAAEWTLDYLRQTAAPAGLDIFPHYGDIPTSPRNWTMQEPRPQLRAPGLSGAEHRFVGGIND